MQGLNIFFRDITQEKKTQEELKASNEKLNAIYQSAKEMAVLLNTNLQITYINKSAIEIFKMLFGKEPQINNSFMDLIPMEFHQKYFDYFKKVIDGETVKMEEDYSETYWIFTIFPVYDAQKQLIGIFYHAQDMTVLKKEELKITQQNKKLREIAVLQSHIVRRPVANILGLANLIKDSENASETELREYVDYIYKATQELDAVIHEITAKTTQIEKVIFEE